MKIDWFDFWVLFSGILLLFLVLGVILKFFHWLQFKKELSYIKQKKVKDIIHPSLEKDFQSEYSTQLFDVKQEIDNLMKDIYFDNYDNNRDVGSDGKSHEIDLEEALDKLLDGKLLNVVKEKDSLLQQKDLLIDALEKRNKKVLKEVVNKMFFLLLEKDKLLKEKDAMILYMKSKLQEIALVDMTSDFFTKSLSQERPVSHSHQKVSDGHQKPAHHTHDLLNVNDVD